MSFCIFDNLRLYERVPVNGLVNIVSLLDRALSQRCVKGIIVLEIATASIDLVRLSS